MSTSNRLTAQTFPIPFPAITADMVQPAVDAAVAEAVAGLDAVAEATTYDGIFGTLDRKSRMLDYVGGIVSHLEGVLDWPEFRVAYNAVQPALATFGARLATDGALFQAVTRLRDSAEHETLGPVQKRHVDKSWEELRRSGAGLDDAGKQRLAALDVELSELTTRFSQNTVDAAAAFELIVTDPERLAGLPHSAREAARASAAEKGQDGWRFTLDGPSYVAALTYLDDASLRQRMYHAYSTRASQPPYDNTPLVTRILELRHEKAKLLGFAHFADLVLEDRMARSGEEALRFLNQLWRAAEPSFRKDAVELLAFRRELEGKDAPELNAWDASYYAEKLRKARYAIDDEQLRPYFPLEKVLSGLFELAHKLFDVKVERVQGQPTWHPDVRVYRAALGARDLGVFYMDLHPRTGKRDGAWMHGLVDGHEGLPGVGLIVGNMTKPDAAGTCLLLHREVVTLFHEFGHLLHHMLSDVPVRALAGTKVAWDFVELPSQILENWTWEEEALAFIAHHHETQAPLPKELIDRLRSARSYRAASALVRQIGFSMVDLALHTTYAPERDGDVLSFSRAILQTHSATPLPKDHAMVTAFNHLFSSPVGYAAGYYSYQWAEALEADAFALFAEHGIFDAKTGSRFVDTILSRGDSQDPRELFRSFRGRDVDPNAMLARIGLA
jgi:oligopeptidase A